MKRFLTFLSAALLAAVPTWSLPGDSVPVYVDFFPLSDVVAVESTWARLGGEWHLLSIRDYEGPVHGDGFDVCRAIRTIGGSPTYLFQRTESVPAEIQAFQDTLWAVAPVHAGIQAALGAAEEGFDLQAVTAALLGRTSSVDWEAIDREELGRYLARSLSMKRDQAILRFAASGGIESTGFARGMGLELNPLGGSATKLERVTAAMTAARVTTIVLGVRTKGLGYFGGGGSPCSPCHVLPFPWSIPCATCCYAGCGPVLNGGILLL